MKLLPRIPAPAGAVYPTHLRVGGVLVLIGNLLLAVWNTYDGTFWLLLVNLPGAYLMIRCVEDYLREDEELAKETPK